MGDRVIFQCYSKNSEGEVANVGPAVYGHWAGSNARKICKRFEKRMEGRANDVSYASARLVQEVIEGHPDGNTSVGIWNQEPLLTAEDSHGDAGVVLIDVSNSVHQYTFLGGYWNQEKFDADN